MFPSFSPAEWRRARRRNDSLRSSRCAFCKSRTRRSAWPARWLTWCGMPDLDAEMKELAQRTAEIREQFLRVELETCFTALDMAKFEMAAGNTHVVMRELAVVGKGIATVERFLPGATAEARPELKVRLAELKAALDSWNREIGPEPQA